MTDPAILSSSPEYGDINQAIIPQQCIELHNTNDLLLSQNKENHQQYSSLHSNRYISKIKLKLSQYLIGERFLYLCIALACISSALLGYDIG